MSNPFKEAALSLDAFLKSSHPDYGIVTFEICDILHHQDCFGFDKAKQTIETIESLLSELSKEFASDIFRYDRYHFLVIHPKARNAKSFASTALRKVKELKIKTVDEQYLRAYPVAPKNDLYLTASALLLDRRVTYSDSEAFLKNACAVHEISHTHRKGLVTTLDLTINEEST